MGWGHSFGKFLSNSASQAKGHEPGWIQRLPSMPGSPQSLQDALIKNKWNSPYGKDQNSADIFAGGVGHPAGSEHPWARAVGRTVGTAFIPYGGMAKGAYGLLGGGSTNTGQQTNGTTNGGNNMSIFSGIGGGNFMGGGDQQIGLDSGGGGSSGGGDMWGGIGNIFGGGLGMLQGRNLQNQYNTNTQNAITQANPLNNPQRQPYQRDLAAMYNDPSAFMANDPFINASKTAVGQQEQANFAKSGNLPLEAIMGSAQFQQVLSQAFNDRIKQFTTLGGFDQGPGYAGLLSLQGQNLGTQAGNNANIGGLNQIFGGMGNMMGGSGGGMGGLFSGIGKMFGSGGGGGGTGSTTLPTDFGSVGSEGAGMSFE